MKTCTLLVTSIVGAACVKCPVNGRLRRVQLMTNVAEVGPNYVSLGILPGASGVTVGSGSTRADILGFSVTDGATLNNSTFEHDLPVTTESIFQITATANLSGVLFTFVS